MPFLTDMNQTYVRKRKKLQHEDLQTPNGRWKVRLNLGFDETGKRIQRSFSPERKKEVEFWVADQLRQRRDGYIRKVINTHRVEDILKVWLEDHVRLTKAETTYHSYVNIVKVIQERLGHADATLTMDTYAHVLHTLQSDTANQFEHLLERKRTAQPSGS
ncbi:hypothetical protein [Exiguobacterium sp. UBA3968]|uniref:hypothetical protein n=1 Tax=Exiguobacterium sp. UBA3968 TaxID=1946492 RepID=UPI0025C30BFA|nr:hypothetical protein [Exiguobacterium sp. UBA3968]